MGTWSIPKGKRGNLANMNKVPGPGNYSPNKDYSKKGPIWKMKLDKNETLRERQISPGPGQYNCAVSQTRKNVPRYGFGKEVKGALKKLVESPGPGKYESSIYKAKIAYTMGIKSNSRERVVTSNNFTTVEPLLPKKNIGGKFSKAKRNDTSRKDGESPGPGAYSTDLTISENRKGKNRGFGMAKRGEKALKREGSPGPGNYNIPSFVDKSKYGVTLKAKLIDNESKKKALLPGPGSYQTENLRYTHKKNPSYIIGSSKLNKNHSKSSLCISATLPGPGTYKPQDQIIKKSASKWKISNAGRNVMDLVKYNSPGPGSYNIEEKSNKNGIKFPKSRRKDGLKAFEPGPGSYCPTGAFLKSNPSFTMQSRDQNLQRSIEKYQELVPGPGAYSTFIGSGKKNQNSISFSKSSRNSINSSKIMSTPGPGTYNIPSTIE
ncbi:unnamed protein product [Moneuplotes crassus]|uniref:Uncharacterized protein n=1 Tax=Euplotes crassus TaxID=5936 RepID=A0AAD1XCV3_EUPCR|nr:unnamed protein product [Moneuplotes crassus]